MSEPVISDEEILQVMAIAGEDCGAKAFTPGETTLKYSRIFARRLLAEFAERVAERLQKTADTVTKAGVAHGYAEAARIVRQSVGGKRD